MLSREYRLKKSSYIQGVLRKGEKYFAQEFILNWRSNNQLSVRFAFIASKKVGGAVQRNRAVRLLREAVHQVMARGLLNRTNCDFVFVARKGLSERRLADVQDQVERAISSATNSFEHRSAER